MSSSIFISAVNNQHTRNLDTNIHAKRKKRDYTILKIRARQNLNFSKNDTTVDMQIYPMQLAYSSELIYDVSKQCFYKTRYDTSGTNSTKLLPDSIKPLFDAIISVSAQLPIGELRNLHNKQNLLEALYLTDLYSLYYPHFDIIEYQLVRLRYGKEVPYELFDHFEEKYPEYLI